MSEFLKIEPDGQGCEICPRCHHYKSCRVPCYHVAEYLRRDNLIVFEKSHTDPETGQTVAILFKRPREIPESDLPQVFADTGIPADQAQRVFNTDAESPFAAFSPRLKQTGIFIDRFFHKLPYSELAAKYEMTYHTTASAYNNAVKRMLEIVKMMDKRVDMTHYRK